jgi:hypothetical protein
MPLQFQLLRLPEGERELNYVEAGGACGNEICWKSDSFGSTFLN